MALTLEVEQRLQAIGLVQFFEDRRAEWQKSAQEAYDYVRKNFPGGSEVRMDDVAKTLSPIMEVSGTLKNHLAAKKATQKYWIKNFTDLIIDRVWDTITQVQP